MLHKLLDRCFANMSFGSWTHFKHDPRRKADLLSMKTKFALVVTYLNLCFLTHARSFFIVVLFSFINRLIESMSDWINLTLHAREKLLHDG